MPAHLRRFVSEAWLDPRYYAAARVAWCRAHGLSFVDLLLAERAERLLVPLPSPESLQHGEGRGRERHRLRDLSRAGLHGRTLSPFFGGLTSPVGT